MTSSIRLALLASAAALAVTGAAHAQTYDRLVSFGDSLSDPGNLYLATNGGQPPLPYNQRFTNDRVWAEYLTAGPTQGFFTVTSYTSGHYSAAFGGARTDMVAANPPGSAAQVANFLGQGGAFGANDVVSLWAGANNIFQGLPTAASNPSTAAAYMTGVSASAAGNVVTQAGQLATAGAKTIMVFNLPDLGKTPQFSADPSASALATVSTTAFNTTLRTGLDTLAGSASGANIIQIDIQSAFNAIIANPQAFGLSNVTQTCISQTACVTGGAAVQDSYLFFDGVHPTAAGHKLVASMASQYLYTPTLTQGAGLMADETYNTRRTLSNDMSGLFAGGQGYFVQVIGQTGSRDKDISLQSQIGGQSTVSAQKAYDYSLAGFRAGAVQSMGGDMTFGIGVTALTGDAEAFMVSARPTDLSIDAGVTWRPGALFMTAQAGVGIGSYSNYERRMTIGAFSATKNQVDVSSYSAALQAGLDHDMGGWTVTPVARLTYASAQMSGFAEAGTIAAVHFEDRKVSALSGAIEARLRGQLSETTSLTGLVGYEAVLSGDAGDLRGRLINNSAHAFSTGMGDVESPGLLLGVGIQTELMGMSVSAGYRGTFGSEDISDQSAMISFNKAF